MSSSISIDTSDLKGLIRLKTGERLSRCYQCGKCSAGCPLVPEMDYPPSQILRMLQHGTPEFEARILKSMSIWLCLTCETCMARCPQEVDIPAIMDFLRAESLRLKMTNPAAKNIIAFHRSFLDSIRYTGRLYEVGLIAAYKSRSFHFFQDLLLAPRMFFKGKLSLFPHVIRNRKALRGIFARSKKQDEVPA